MQFITNGPDIPDALLQAHEEGRVVFFCGAGISYPAGLPLFKGLVDDIYKKLGATREPLEEEAYARWQYDATLDLLERRVAGQRLAVRKALSQILKPNLRLKGATDSHTALLQLARCRNNALRLVTTNFDPIFELVAKRKKQKHNSYVAPMLPIPKNSRWDGVVYLHGRLPDKPDQGALNRMVLTSGDFGLAYLTERWAARFVSELFRNYVVCFVGYSINDPVMRYMMDALAADRMLGEVTLQAYAFGEYSHGQEDKKMNEWGAKGVTPILYEVPKGTNNHSALHQTLKAWSETYRDGVLGKERIVVDYAMANPAASTKQDDFVGRMLWAISHESGLPAKRFAEISPAPPLSWLEAFSSDRFQHDALSRFGVPPQSETDEKLRFSLIHRPAPYHRAPRMALASIGTTYSQWDDVMFQLARWLIRHLNDPTLIIWLTQRGGQLDERLAGMIQTELERLSRLHQEDKKIELNEIRSNSPNAIPDPSIQKLWHLMLAGQIKQPRAPFHKNLFNWKERLKYNGLNSTLRLELRELLEPKIILKQPFRWLNQDEHNTEPKNLKQMVDWELVLNSDHLRSYFPDSFDEHWRKAFPELLSEFQKLLCDALDLFKELGESDGEWDRSYYDLPSIHKHWQNRGFHDWVFLIEFLRDAWTVTLESDPRRATRIALEWFDLPYVTFKRLALFAASQDEGIGPDLWVECLVRNEGQWLWSSCTQRETSRLLALQGSKIPSTAMHRLEEVILAGPPRSRYQDDIEPEQWAMLVEHAIWLRLVKLESGGAKISDIALQRLTEIRAVHPDLKLSPHEKEEFSHWMSGTGDPDYESNREIDIAPKRRRDLVKWLKQAPPLDRLSYEDTWREMCRNHFPQSFLALYVLAKEDFWSAMRWRVALQTWSENGKILRSWRFAAPLVQTMPIHILQEVKHAVAWWLENVAKSIERHEDIFLKLCQRILELPYLEPEAADNNRPLDKAINHPIGLTTQALLSLWFKRSPNDNDMLPEDISPMFTQLSDTQNESYRHGRVLLASNLIALFRVDRSWTEKNLLPLFNWNTNHKEAKAVWEGFLWSPRLYRPLLTSLKPYFLETANHYSDLGNHNQQYVTFLTYAALESIEGYTPQDFASTIAALPNEGFKFVAQALSQALESSGDQRENYWKHRVQPFWQQIWPKSRDRTTPEIVGFLARLCIAAGAEFPSSLETIHDWLIPIDHPNDIIWRLKSFNLCERFPDESLRLLDAVISNQQWLPHELKDCLDAITLANPELRNDSRYRKLDELVRRRGT